MHRTVNGHLQDPRRLTSASTAFPLLLTLSLGLAGCGSQSSDEAIGSVQAWDAAAALSASTDVTPPSAPSNLTWANTGMTVVLSWTASTADYDVMGYQLYFGNFYLGQFADTSLSLIGFKAGTPYNFTVKAIDAAGNVSQASNQVTVLIQVIGQDSTPPTAPNNLTATSVGSTSVALRWSASSDDVGVVVYQLYSNGTLASTVPMSTSGTVSGLQPATTYSFTVKAADAAGNLSSASSSLAVTTLTAGGGGGGTPVGGGGGGSSLPATCVGICNAFTAAPPTLSSNGGQGSVTMYDTLPSSGGACNYGVTNINYYAAMNVSVQPGDGLGQWQNGRICGQCAEVTALTSQGLKTTVVRIMDRCADANCGIDLGGAAPAAIMANGPGRYLGQWRFVSCAGHPEVSDGVPSINVVSGSNAWWARLRVMNPVLAVQGITWKTATSAGSLPYAHDPENSYEVPVSDVLQSTNSSVQLTVTYSDGGTATAQLTPAQLGTGGSTYPLQ